MWSLTLVEGRLIAAGSTSDESGTHPVAWWSDDGTTWIAVDMDAEGSVWVIAPGGAEAVAVGTSPAGERAMIWITPPVD